MIAYRLICDETNEVIFGIKNDSKDKVINKLNKGLQNIRPYNYLVPYYNNSNAKFAFQSKDAFYYFLYDLCKFTDEDIQALKDKGFKVIKLNLGVYSCGYSKILCTFFDDEIVEFKMDSIENFCNNADSYKHNYTLINYTNEIAKEFKQNHYKNIKFYS